MSNPPGVPPLLSNEATFDNVALVAADAFEILGQFAAPQWGIFDQGGNPVIVGDSTLAFEFTRDSNVSKYPVEQGGFESYNKVQTPFGLKYTFTKAGSVGDRANFLNEIDAVQNSLGLFVGLTPEIAYPNITIDHYDTRRTARAGVTLLTVDVWCEQIRLAPPLQFSNAPTSGPAPVANPQNPEAADPTNDGTVQPVVPGYQTSTAGTATTPATIQQPGVSLTNSVGNTPPASAPAPVGSVITYSGNSGPATGVVSGVSTSVTTGAILGYNLTDGSFVGTHLVTSITPPGFTTVQ